MLHPAEYYCRRVLGKCPWVESMVRDHVLPNRSDMREKGLWPDGCEMPMGLMYAVLTDGADVPDAKEIMQGLGTEALPSSTAAWIWLRHKQAYRFHPRLRMELERQPLDGDLPQELFHHLPVPCVYIEGDGMLGSMIYQGFFAWMEKDLERDWWELRLMAIDKAWNSKNLIVPLVDGNLHDADKALQDSAIDRVLSGKAPDCGPGKAPGYSDGTETMEEMVAMINLTLYLCSDDTSVHSLQGSHSHDRHSTRTIIEKVQKSEKARACAKSIEVGYVIGSALEKSEKQGTGSNFQDSNNDGKLHASSAAHVRRAHWHHYWTGHRTDKSAGSEMILHWIPPVLVGNTDLVTTVHRVK